MNPHQRKPVAQCPPNAPTCPLEHRCACCGGPALLPGHTIRAGTMDSAAMGKRRVPRARQCRPNFRVRCMTCRADGKLPIELDEHIWSDFAKRGGAARAFGNGVKVVFDIA